MKRIHTIKGIAALITLTVTLFAGISCKSTEPAVVPPPAPVVTPEPEPEPEPAPENDEYTRSVSGIDVSRDTFEDDKAKILANIQALSEIMAERQYGRWLKYLDQESIAYWSDPRHLASASKMLPQKGMKLKDMEAYFKYVFIPSRSRSKVDEIRYINEDLVQAVEVRTDKDVVYYTFKKENGFWMLHLQPLE